MWSGRSVTFDMKTSGGVCNEGGSAVASVRNWFVGGGIKRKAGSTNLPRAGTRVAVSTRATGATLPLRLLPPMGATLSPMVEKARVKLSSLGMGCGPGGHQAPPSMHFRVLETVVGQVGSLGLG